MMPFEQWFLFLFGFISIFVYLLIVLTLRKHNKDALLGGTFFQLVIYQFYTDSIFFMEFTITMRLRKYSEFYSFFETGSVFDGVIPRILSAVHYYIKIVVYIGYILFGLNRFLITFNLTTLKREGYAVWSPTVLHRIKIVQWALPILAVIPSHGLPSYKFYYVVTADSIRLNNDAVSTLMIAYIDGICSTITCLFCILCYLFTCCSLRKGMKRSSTVAVVKTSSSQMSAEKGLLISAILSFLVLMMNTSIQVSKIVTSWLSLTNIFSIYDLSYPLNDLMYSHFPWVLLITSSVLRKQLAYDVRMYIRSKLKLDEASMSLSRSGTINQATRMTSRTEI